MFLASEYSSTRLELKYFLLDPALLNISWIKALCLTWINFQFQISLQKFGCTTPYGKDKSKICTDPEIGNLAFELYKKARNDKSFALEKCPVPCGYQSIELKKLKIGDVKEFNAMLQSAFENKLTLKYSKFIKVFSSSVSYTFLELVAEVGGYVGLFLGVSIIQTIDLLPKVAKFFSLLKQWTKVENMTEVTELTEPWKVTRRNVL